MKTTDIRMAMIFNEWAQRYARNPEEFNSILGDDGKPCADYGESCTRYFRKLEEEMDAEDLPLSPTC